MGGNNGNQKNGNRTLRLILMLALAAALVYAGARLTQSTPQAQSMAEETAEPLTLLTDPPQTAAGVGDGGVSAAEETTAAQTLPEELLPVESGSYSEVEDVAYYLHAYGHLPDNYITKAEAEDAGWVPTGGNLWDVAYGSSIGGDRYQNSEGLLPRGEKYYECDVNYGGGYRGAERIVYSEDGDIYYTSDHYATFEKLY